MRITVDPHTHSIFSVHAFSTIEENALHAKEAGMEAIGMTDHYGPGFCQLDQFSAAMNMDSLPALIHGVRILAGTEIDIIDSKGTLAGMDSCFVMSPERNAGESLLKSREVTIASVHYFDGMHSLTEKESTGLYLNVLENPYVNILGHIGRSGLPFSIDEVVKKAADAGKIIELNEHSMGFSKHIEERCTEIAKACARYGASVCVSSDAHSGFFIGKFQKILSMLEEIKFPQELVANTSLSKFMKVIEKGNAISGR